eukprot:350173-Chlamydomonas_euryale.AAC.2
MLLFATATVAAAAHRSVALTNGTTRRARTRAEAARGGTFCIWQFSGKVKCSVKGSAGGGADRARVAVKYRCGWGCPCPLRMRPIVSDWPWHLCKVHLQASERPLCRVQVSMPAERAEGGQRPRTGSEEALRGGRGRGSRVQRGCAQGGRAAVWPAATLNPKP